MKPGTIFKRLFHRPGNTTDHGRCRILRSPVMGSDSEVGTIIGGQIVISTGNVHPSTRYGWPTFVEIINGNIKGWVDESLLVEII